MSLPDGWTALPFAAAGGVPQAVPLTGPVPGLLAVLVAEPADLARLLSAPADQAVHDAAERLARRAKASGRPGTAGPAHVVAVQTALAAFTAGPPDSLATAAVPAWIVVRGVSGVLGTWPALPGRALPVRGGGRYLGDLWIGELCLAAGSLTEGGEHGSRISIGWRPAGGPAATAAMTAAAAGPTEEDPYAGLI